MDDRHNAMESSVDSAAELFSLIEDKGALCQPKTPNSAVENDGRTISVQVLEFKTSLLEAVEELHIHRDAERRYEEQICKLVLEKQELEWKTESLQSQISRMSVENSESLAAVKKQFQAQIRMSEVEKGKNLLATELKDKEITSLKEELKQLQLLRYSLEKKLGELEQKLQLQTQTKDSHLNQLGEVERRFTAISRQCAMIRQAHEKLEQNVEEAMRINKKLTSISEKQESTIKVLKEDFERCNKELVAFKVSSVCKPGEERLQDILREQQIQQLQQKLFVETELNQKLRIETANERADKQEVMKSLQHSQSLLQTQTEALSRTEKELRALCEEYQVLKTEHELNQDRTKEREDSFARMRDECQNSKLTWEKEILRLQLSMKADQEELIAVKEAYSQLQEEYKHLYIANLHKAQDIHYSEIALKNQENSLSTTSNEINFVKVSSLHTHLKESHIIPYDNSEPTHQPDKDVPEESQKASKDVCFHYDDTERAPVLLQSIVSDNIARPEDVSPMMNHLSELCGETNMGVSENEPTCNAVDKRCPSIPTQSDTDSRLTELSGPETRSVYHIDGDPLALELKDRPLLRNLCTSEVTERQTSDKHADSQGYTTSQSNKFKDHQTTVPGFIDCASQKESQTTSERLSEDKTENADTQKTVEFYDKRTLKDDMIATKPRPCNEAHHEEHETKPESPTYLDSQHSESKEFSSSEKVQVASLSLVPQVYGSAETSLHELKSEQLPLINDIALVNSVHMIFENDDQKNIGTSDSEPLKPQQTELGGSYEDSKTTNSNQDPYSSGSTMLKVQSDVDQKNISLVDTSNHFGDQRYQSSFTLDPLVDQTILVASANTKEVLSENGQKDDGISDSELLKPQQTELGASSEESKTTYPNKDPSSLGSTAVNVQEKVDQNNISVEDTSYHLGNQVCQSYFPLEPLDSQTISATTISTKEVVFENGQKSDGISDSQPLKTQQSELEVSAEEAKTTSPDQDNSHESTTAKKQLDVSQKDISVSATSNHLENRKSQSSFALDIPVDHTTSVTSINKVGVIYENAQNDVGISDSELLKPQQGELRISPEGPKTSVQDHQDLSSGFSTLKAQSDIDLNHISEKDASSHLENRNHHSSFPLSTLVDHISFVGSINRNAILENYQKHVGISDSELLKPQQTEPGVSFKDPKFRNPDQYCPSPGPTMVKVQSGVEQKNTSVVDTSNYLRNRKSQSPFACKTFVDHTTSVARVDTMKVMFENGQKDDRISSLKPLKAQQTELRSSSEEPKTIQPNQDPPSPPYSKAKNQSEVTQRYISDVDTINHPDNRRRQSSFAWDTFLKGNRKPQIPSRPELWPSGFHKNVSQYCAPLFTKDKLANIAITKTHDRMDTSIKRLPQKSDNQGEWNAIKQSFPEMLMEKENPVHISYCSTRSCSPAPSSMGNGLRQDCTPTVPPPKLQSLEKQDWPMTSSSEGKDERKQSDIMAQIAKIQEFMSSEGLMPQKRRKID
ncbi:coiled-coil domain-containing protein 73 [Danio rerio]|uniref:Coiled-coil domain-containing protein 73 n=1 Tax=Danio rerio TaxID=7955 RepID=A0AB13A8K0_DANRE|nr:coiled-coil domain containing 73 [Danio rerio]